MGRCIDVLAATVIITLICLAADGPSAAASIVGSKHDFGSLGWSQNQICQPCHAPHDTVVRDSAGALVYAPLWNHALTTATYTLYIDPDTGTGVTGEIDGNSRLCLSCHDGTVALDSFGGKTGSQQIGNARAVVGFQGDLTNDHPIGEAAVWPTPNPASLVDPSLREAADIMPLRELADGRKAVGCTSCHEPHNRKGTEHMLWVNNSGTATTVDGRGVSGSVLCQNCHQMSNGSAPTRPPFRPPVH